MNIHKSRFDTIFYVDDEFAGEGPFVKASTTFSSFATGNAVPTPGSLTMSGAYDDMTVTTVPASSCTLVADSDSWVRSDRATANYGLDNKMEVRPEKDISCNRRLERRLSFSQPDQSARAIAARLQQDQGLIRGNRVILGKKGTGLIIHYIQ